MAVPDPLLLGFAEKAAAAAAAGGCEEGTAAASVELFDDTEEHTAAGNEAAASPAGRIAEADMLAQGRGSRTALQARPVPAGLPKPESPQAESAEDHRPVPVVRQGLTAVDLRTISEDRVCACSIAGIFRLVLPDRLGGGQPRAAELASWLAERLTSSGGG